MALEASPWATFPTTHFTSAMMALWFLLTAAPSHMLFPFLRCLSLLLSSLICTLHLTNSSSSFRAQFNVTSLVKPFPASMNINLTTPGLFHHSTYLHYNYPVAYKILICLSSSLIVRPISMENVCLMHKHITIFPSAWHIVGVHMLSEWMNKYYLSVGYKP